MRESGATPRSAAEGRGPWRQRRGVIRYLRPSTGAVRGEERFVLTRAPDGSRTVRSLSWIVDVRGGVLRDVTYTVDGEWRPQQCFTRLEVGGMFHGAGWLVREGKLLLASAVLADRGRIAQQVRLPGRFAVIAHPVVLDAWQFPAAYDHDRGGEQRWTVYDLSPGGEGYDGPLGWVHRNGGIFLGEEPMTAPAGTFLCRHYRILPDAFASIDVWVTSEDVLLVVMDWPGFDARYELIELRDD
ncbi:MAG: hypothetical protein KatS3mg061_0256 [Dehalococcoidia bacterium]|nr:MAG: hypothetical protein KatS3mg061_0256 [Dehalococcoidia bacterium]